jgi:UDP-N-acetylglucosamine acyltransferase
VFHAGCVIGDAPQDLKYRGEPTEVTIGDDNVFREHVTVHRSTKVPDQTRVGSNNFLMANCHIGHNVTVGDRVIIGNGALLAGHAVIEDRAFISGNGLVHQFVRVGTLSLIQGGAAISKDLPPFTVARAYNGICGLNVVGLRRAGLSSEDRLELRRLYQHLFRSGLRLGEALAAAGIEFSREPSRRLLAFVVQSKRGICMDTRLRSSGAQPTDDESEEE